MPIATGALCLKITLPLRSQRSPVDNRPRKKEKAKKQGKKSRADKAY